MAYINSQKPYKLEKPRLQLADYTSVRQYAIFDPSTIINLSHQTLNTRIPSIVWQQQMGKAYIQRHNKMHMIHKTFPTLKHDYTEDIDTQFRPLPEVVTNDTFFVDPQSGLDTYWDEDLYDQDKLEYKDPHTKSNDQIESDHLIMDAHASDTLRYALIDFWTVNPQLRDTSPLPNIQPRQQNQQRQTALIDNQYLPQLQVTPDGLTSFLPLSANLPLKNKRKMPNFLMDFRELHINGLKVTCALSSAIPENDLRKIRIMAPQTVFKKGPPPEFQIRVAIRRV